MPIGGQKSRKNPRYGNHTQHHPTRVAPIEELLCPRRRNARAIDQRLATLPATRNLSATRRSALAHASAGALFSLLN